MPLKIIRKNKWARIVSHGDKGYVVEASGPHGWIAQSDYTSRTRALSIYKKLSDRSAFKKKQRK